MENFSVRRKENIESLLNVEFFNKKKDVYFVFNDESLFKKKKYSSRGFFLRWWWNVSRDVQSGCDGSCWEMILKIR